MVRSILFMPTLCFSLLCISPLSAQFLSKGIGTTTPDSSARLDVSATNQGVLIPRTDTGLIANPAEGLMIYMPSDDWFWYFDGIRWRRVGEDPKTIVHADFGIATNIADTAEQLLKPFTIPGNTLTDVGSWLEILTFGTYWSVSDNAKIRIRINGDLIAGKADTIFTAGFSSFFQVSTRYYRVTNTLQRAVASGGNLTSTGGSNHFHNLSAPLTVQITAQNDTALANTVFVAGFTIRKVE